MKRERYGYDASAHCPYSPHCALLPYCALNSIVDVKKKHNIKLSKHRVWIWLLFQSCDLRGTRQTSAQ